MIQSIDAEALIKQAAEYFRLGESELTRKRGQHQQERALVNRCSTLIAALALREKQIQQNYRPIIGVHKWFARRPGSLFRGLVLSEFSN